LESKKVSWTCLRQERRSGEVTESARAIPTFDACGSRKLPHVVVAGFFAVETGFDTITFIFDLGKRKVDFRGNTSDIEASDIYT
jgi:hypothetical protein